MRLYNNGAELQSTSLELGSSSSTSSPAIDITIFRSGAASWKFAPSGSGRYIETVICSAVGNLYTGAAVYFTSFPTADSMVLWNVSSASGLPLSSISVGASGVLKLHDGDASGTQIGSSGPSLSLNTWYYLELKTANGGSPETEARLNMVSFASGSYTESANSKRIGWGLHENNGGVLYVDDIKVNNDIDFDGTYTSPTQNSWVTDSKLIVLRPNGDGDAHGLTTAVGGTAGVANNYTRVNEIIPDDATTYNGGNTSGMEDMYAMSDSGIGTNDVVNVVAINGRKRESAAGTGPTFKMQIKKTTGGTIGTPYPTTLSHTTTSTSFSNNFVATPDTFTNMFYADPDGSAWTKATLDTMQAGIKLNSTTTNLVHLTTLWVYVDYTPFIPHVSHTTDANKKKSGNLVTHTTDSNKKKSGLTVSHTTSANKRITGIIKTHTTDAFKRIAVLKTHTTDSNKKKSTLVSHTTDANKKKSGLTVTHTTDSLKRKQFTLSHTTDSNKKKTNTLSHTTNSNIKKSGLLKIHTTDANKKKSLTVSHTTDSLKRKTNTVLHTTDSNKKTSTTKTHTTDALKRQQFTKSHTTDSLKRVRSTASHATDAYTYKNAQTLSVDYFNFSFGTASFTTSHTTDSLKRKVNTKTHTTDALKKTRLTLTHTTDANKRKVTLLTHTADANKRKATLVAHTTDALKRTVNTKTHTTDALKRTQFTKAHTTDSFLRKQFTKTHTTDSNKRKATTASHTTDSLKRTANTRTHTTDSLKRKIFTLSHTTDSVLRKQSTKIHTTDSNKRKATLVSHTTDSNKKKSGNLLTHSTSSNKRKLFTQSHTTDALLRKQFTLVHTTDSLKRKANTRTHTTDANKRKATLVNHTTDANKRVTGNLRSHTTDALKRTANTRSHTTDSLKRKIGTLSHTTSSYLTDRRNYSRTSIVSLPTNSNTLPTVYSPAEVAITTADDSVYVDEAGTLILIHEFEYRHINNSDAPTFHWNGKSTVDCSVSPIYLQIWNVSGSVWETLDSNSTTTAGTDLDLYGFQNSNISNYYDTGNKLVFRVYQ